MSEKPIDFAQLAEECQKFLVNEDALDELVNVVVLIEKCARAFDRAGKIEEALRDAVRGWSFNDAQQPTHTWHDREDWYARHEVARALREEAK